MQRNDILGYKFGLSDFGAWMTNKMGNKIFYFTLLNDRMVRILIGHIFYMVQ
jgi:hypothetical protein